MPLPNNKKNYHDLLRIKIFPLFVSHSEEILNIATKQIESIRLVPTFLHVSERWITEAVWTQRVTLATGSRCPQHKLKVIQWTAELLVQLDGSILRKTVGLITVGAVKPAGLGLQIHLSIRCYRNSSKASYRHNVGVT